MSDWWDNELFSAYLDGELTAAEQARVERLLAANSAARQLLDELRALSISLQELPRQTLHEDLGRRVLRLAEHRLLRDPMASESPRPGMTNLYKSFPCNTLRRRCLACFGLVSAAAMVLAVLVLPPLDRDMAIDPRETALVTQPTEDAAASAEEESRPILAYADGVEIDAESAGLIRPSEDMPESLSTASSGSAAAYATKGGLKVGADLAIQANAPQRPRNGEPPPSSPASRGSRSYRFPAEDPAPTNQPRIDRDAMPDEFIEQRMGKGESSLRRSVALKPSVARPLAAGPSAAGAQARDEIEEPQFEAEGKDLAGGNPHVQQQAAPTVTVPADRAPDEPLPEHYFVTVAATDRPAIVELLAKNKIALLTPIAKTAEIGQSVVGGPGRTDTLRVRAPVEKVQDLLWQVVTRRDSTVSIENRSSADRYDRLDLRRPNQRGRDAEIVLDEKKRLSQADHAPLSHVTIEFRFVGPPNASRAAGRAGGFVPPVASSSAPNTRPAEPEGD